MASDRELDRLASMAAILRPDWPQRSLRTLLQRPALAARPYADLAVALAAVATDPRSVTPARLAEHGPWWTAAYTAAANPTNTVADPPTCIRHDGQPAGRCEHCAAEAVPPPIAVLRAAVRGGSRR